MGNPEPIRVILDQPASSWIKDWGAPLSALVVALISNVILWLKIKAEYRAGVRKELLLRSIEDLETRLSTFYDPVLAMLQLNRAIFESMGPKTFPENVESRIDAAKAWETATKTVILPNNSKICDLLLSSSHLLDPESSAVAQDFLRHAVSYSIFKTKANVVHRSFPYPEKFVKLIESERNLLMNQLNGKREQFKEN